MSNIIQESWGGVLRDFIDSLPESAIPLKHYEGRRLKPMYWYDSKLKRLIRRMGKYEPHPYAYYSKNSFEISLQFMSGKNTRAQTQDLIDSIEQSFPTPEEVEDMILINMFN